MKKKLCLFLLMFIILAILPAVALAAADSTPSASASSESTMLAETSPPSESPSSTPQSASLLSIDNARVYAGMDKPYSQGYIPSVQGGTASVVLPLVASGDIRDSQINITVDLGDASSSPFVFGNYDQTIDLQNNPVNNGAGTQSSYLVSLSLPMISGRTNGRYPVAVTAQYAKADGAQLSQSFTVYVTISDGIDPNATPAPSPTPTPTPTEAPLPQPKIIVNNHTITPADVMAGGTFDLNITLLNTSEGQSVQNIKITAKGETADLIPVEDTGSAYIKKISGGKTADFQLKMQVRQDAKPGPQKVLLTIEYENSKATAFTANEEIIVQVKQPIRLEYDKPTIPESVNAGDTVSFSLNLMNMGKSTLYNVRYALEAPGMIPEGSAFIGNMESGTSKTGDIYVFVGTLDMTGSSGSDNNSSSAPGDAAGDTNQSGQYGPTQGKITITYEDEYGQEYNEQIDFATTINPPVIQPVSAGEEETEEPETVSQWWVSVIIAGGIAAGLIVFLKIRKKRRLLAEDENEVE